MSWITQWARDPRTPALLRTVETPRAASFNENNAMFDEKDTTKDVGIQTASAYAMGYR
jgi:hypothetical protein